MAIEKGKEMKAGVIEKFLTKKLFDFRGVF